jgi:coatomer protein complex subunit alpha (xenin)
MVNLAREYVVGLMLETERQRLVAEEPDNQSRILELAALFTHCNLQPAHIQLALRSAMRVFAKAGNNATAAVFARRLVDMKPADSKVVSSVSD